MVWAFSAFVLTLGQVRFLPVYAIAIGIAISILFFQILEFVKRRMADQKLRVPRALAPILLRPIILPTAVETGIYVSRTNPPIASDWYDSLSWLRMNSNTTSFSSPSEVPEYSVMSWWDTGNWIVYVAERPVVANNFEEGVKDAVKFYLSESEESATAIWMRGAQDIS